MKCPYCNSEDILEEKSQTVIKQGLHRMTAPANNYRCNKCKRAFISKEQKDETSEVLTKKTQNLPMKDMRNGA